MIVIGLTGSVASGKSTVAGWMSEKGIAVHDADLAVHSLLAANGIMMPKIANHPICPLPCRRRFPLRLT